MLENVNDNKAPRGSIAQIILKALSSGDKYGYEICKYIEKSTDGKLILKQPSLYSSLRRMELQGLISSYWEDSNLGGRRHYYKLTIEGKEFIESNREMFASDEDLINNLPQKISGQKLLADDEYKDDVENNNSQMKTSVLKQENLFSLTQPQKNLSMPKKIENEAQKSEKQDSFFQFDLFNERVSFVKDENKNEKDDIPQFTNKFSNLDNHSEEIEPQEIFVNDKIFNSPTPLGAHVKNQDFITSRELDSSKVQEQKNNDQVRLYDSYSNGDVFVEANKTSSEISWNDNTNIEKEPANYEDDYKSVIGQLYNNSRLQDPYEENKFQTFKEIFPSSKYVGDDDKKEDLTIEEGPTDKNIASIIKSGEESNIDCEDIKNLNNLYNLQGIEIKIHNKKENKKDDKAYTDKNKLKMVAAWILSSLMFLEILFSYLIFRDNEIIMNKQRIVFYLAIAFVLSYCIIATLENFLDRYRLVIIEKNIKRILMTRIFVFIILIILIFAVNIMLGMTSLLQKEFIVTWFVPSLISTNILLYTLVYYLLLRSNIFTK